MGSSLALRDISKSFGSNHVLNEVSIDIEPGEFLSLVGPSGCGKSTLLRIIAGLERQERGSVLIGERAVDDLGPRARNIAMVFQNYALYPHMSAFDNIALPLSVAKLSLYERLPIIKHASLRRRQIAREISDSVNAVANQLQIEPLLTRKPGQLSGGQRQRVALARAMVRQPSVFLMDEPLSNLDAQLRVHMRDELADLHARLGATFVYVTHDQVEAMTMSTRVAMLDHGRLAQLGRPRDLYERPATLTVARFIGSPTINVLPGCIGESGRIMLFDQPLPLAVNLKTGSAVSVGIRPEDVVLTRGPNVEGLLVRLRRIEHHGAERLVFAELEPPVGGAIIARVAGSGAPIGDLTPGETATVSFNPANVHLFDNAGDRVDAREVVSGGRIRHMTALASQAAS